MSKKDYYEILGISKTSNDREIKKAYKRLAVKYHPDRNPEKGASIKFKEIKEAYEILIDKNKRAAYDQYGHSAFNQQNINEEYSTDFGDIFGDVFGDIFGRNRNKKKVYKGEDLYYSIEINLEVAVKGINQKIYIPILKICNLCNGTGAKSDKFIISCNTCQGSGNIYIRQGFFSVQQTCHTCNGKGKIIKQFCQLCHGRGKIEKNKVLLIKIPAGINDGDKIRLSGKGESGGKNTIPGDLYVEIKIKPHALFKRNGNDLYCEVPINYPMAALGGEIEVPSINGKIKFKIPKETQTGKLFRIKGKGVKSLKNKNIGDLLCKVIVETPVNLNQKQKCLLNDLGKSLGNSQNINSPKSKNFFNSVKKFFDNITK